MTAPVSFLRGSRNVLSSQANIAGYKAVMMAADKYQALLPDGDLSARFSAALEVPRSRSTRLLEAFSLKLVASH